MVETATIDLQPAGISFGAREDETVLEAALRQQIYLPYACRGGSCGSCAADLIHGSLELCGPGLSAREIAAPAKVRLCISTARAPVTLRINVLDEPIAAEVLRFPVKVVRIQRPAPDIAVLTLKYPPRIGLEFRPGQYVLLDGPDGCGRAFSFATAPRSDDTFEVHIGLVPDGRFSQIVREKLKAGDLLRAQGPFGTFGLSSRSDRPAVFVAGGTGISPFLAILEDLVASGRHRKIHLYWGARRADHLYDLDRLRELVGALPQSALVLALSDIEPNDCWQGRRGFIHREVLKDLPDLSDFEVYVCGNPALIAAAQDFVELGGLSAENLRTDEFLPLPVNT